MRDFHLPGRSTVHAANGICATSHPLAAKVGVQMLEAGGNAVDAAIAASVLLGICEPQMTGIGGDCFVLVAPPGEEPVALNGSGRAPAGIDAAALRATGADRIVPGDVNSVTVPGAVDAFCALSARYGKMGLAASLAPAVHYAEAGVPVAPRTAFDWQLGADGLQGAARDHYLDGGAVPPVGRLFRSPAQAEVLRRIATDGREAFYEGEVAEDMVAALQAAGGPHTLEDFAATACDWGSPVSGSWGGLEVLEHPPNGQGATALLMLNMLKRFDLAAMDPRGAERAHLEAEIAKLAYDARNRIVADPAHAGGVDRLLSQDLADRLAALVRPDAVLPEGLPGAGAAHRDTVYVTVVDRDRMAVSLIYSIFRKFGSGIASEKYGILFQNRGSGFTLEEGHPNEAGPGKRPMHTIIPGLLRRDGALAGAFGVMGGQYQAAGHARFVTNMETFGMDVQEAIDAPRSFPDGGELRVERGYGDDVRARLAELGHPVAVPEEPIGGAQAILLTPEGTLVAGSDPRKDGCALGY